MQKSIAFKFLVLSLIGSTSLSCKDEEPSAREIPEEFTKLGTNNLAVQKKRAKLKAYFDSKKESEAKPVIIEEKKAEAKIAFPYTLAPPFAALKKELTTPIGKVSGGVFGTDNDVYAVLRTQCGEGSVLQVVFKSGTDFQVSPPIPVKFIKLDTKKVVTYQEGRFNISVNFSEDSAEKLKGNFNIDFIDNEGNKKIYIDLKVDGLPRPFLLPTKMKGKGKLPTYDWCTPTAYVGIKQATKDWVYGYAHVRDVNKLNIPKVRLMFSDRDGMDLLLVPLSRGSAIPANTKIDVKTAREAGQNPAVLKIDTWRIEEINNASEATGANLNKLAKTILLDGKANVELKKAKSDKQWKVDIQLKDFSISSLMMGPFQDEPFSEIRIFGYLADPGKMKSSLPEAPAWWKKVKDEGTKATEKP